MRLLVLIVIGVAGYYGWQAYQKDPQFLSKYLPNQQTEETQSADSAETPANTAEAPAAPSAPAAPAAPVFVSKIAVPAGSDGSDQKLPPGQFLMLERVSVETKDGVTAIVAGDLVKLIERRPNGTLQVTNGQHDFVVKESQVTQEVSVARDAERREFQKRYGAR
jgi:uncharacterized protein YlzI (FlbEa/FlbD family)